MITPWRARRGFPGPEGHPHGTRARYVSGCRCAPCKASNLRGYHARQARALSAALEYSGPRPSRRLTQLWTRAGVTRSRSYALACPGIDGRPCEGSSHLRKDSKAGICRRCRNRLVWNGLVDATAARKHILTLSHAGVGRDALAAAADVGVTAITEIRIGRRRRIRADEDPDTMNIYAGWWFCPRCAFRREFATNAGALECAAKHLLATHGIRLAIPPRSHGGLFGGGR